MTVPAEEDYSAYGEVELRPLPLSLSYDHRVINGADAARFVLAIGATLCKPGIMD